MTKQHRQVVLLPVDAIRTPGHSIPGDPAALRRLAAEMVQNGFRQPLTVRPIGRLYELLSGEQRLRAARLAGLREVPCLLRTEADGAADWERLWRRDLDYVERARLLAQLMAREGLSQAQAAARTGKSQSAVANTLRLLQHPPEVLAALQQTGLSERHARALLRAAPEARLALIEQAAGEHWTVAALEEALDTAPPASALEPLLRAIRGLGLCCSRQEGEGEWVLTIRVPHTDPHCMV